MFASNEGLGFITLLPALISAGTTIYTAEQQRKIAAQQAAAAQAQAVAISQQAEAEKAKTQQAGFQLPSANILLLLAVAVPAVLYITSKTKGK